MNDTEVSGRHVAALLAACALAFGVALLVGRIFGGFVEGLTGLALLCAILGGFAVWVSRTNDSQPRHGKRPRALLVALLIALAVLAWAIFAATDGPIRAFGIVAGIGGCVGVRVIWLRR